MSGSLTLAGGGWGADPGIWTAFVEDAAERAGGGVPRVAVVSIRDGDQQQHAADLIAALRAAGPIEPVVLVIADGEPLDAAPLAGVHGLLVGGGSTPAYLDALAPHAERIRALVADGVPYAGFSAGSAIAAERAVIGGWRMPSGHPVVDEDVAEGLDPVTVRAGLGLTDRSVEAHAAQWGTLARLIAAVDDGVAPGGVAIDEDTAVLIRGGATRVVGTGNAWWVSMGDGGALVLREPAG